MANVATLLILRSYTNIAPLTGLQNGQLAYSYLSNNLFIGSNTGPIVIGGLATVNYTKSAYGRANAAMNLATYAAHTANNAYANGVFLQGINDQQNTWILSSWAHANSGYAQANAANNLATSAYGQANVNASILSNTITYTSGINSGQNAYAQAAYAQANTGTQLAQDAYDYANSIPLSSISNGEYTLLLTETGNISMGSAFSIEQPGEGTVQYTFEGGELRLAQIGFNTENGPTQTWINNQGYSTYLNSLSIGFSSSPSYWVFNRDGSILFPDGSYQNTAYQNVVWYTANAANDLATSAFAQANAADSLASSAYNTINTNASFANTTLTYIAGVNDGQNAFTQASYDQANAISSHANTTLTYIAGVDDGQNTFAQAAFDTVNLNASFANTTLTYIGGVNDGQNTFALAAFDTVNLNASFANTTLTHLAGVNDGQNTFALAAFDLANLNSTTANTTLTYLSGVNDGQNAYSEAAFASINLNASYANTTLTHLAGVNDGQNAYSEAAYSQANAISSYANTTLTYIAGVNDGQNAYVDSAYASLNLNASFANTTLTYIAGVDLGQNAYAQAAYTQANTATDVANAAVANIGPVITTNSSGIVIISNTAPSSNPTTGALQVRGGLGVIGNTHVSFAGYFGDTYGATSFDHPVIVAVGNANSYAQLVVQNKNSGKFASSDLVATADNGNDEDTYIDVGINSSTYEQEGYELTGPNDGYLYVAGNTVTGGGNLVVSTFTEKDIIISLNGASLENEYARFEYGTGFVTKYPIKFVDGTSQNTAAAPWDYSNAAFAQANAADSLAQSAFNTANAAGSNEVVVAAYAQANVSANIANAAYDQANAISSYANTTLSYISGVDTGQNAYAEAAYSQANAISSYANTTLTYIAGVNDGQNAYSESSYAQANAISSYANTTLTYHSGIQDGQNAYSESAYAQANAISSYANTTLTYVGGVNDGQNAYAQAAYSAANANAAYANTALTYLQGVADGANAYAQAAYSAVNTNASYANTTLTYLQGVVDGANAYAQAAYDTVNLNALFANTTLTYYSGIQSGQNAYAEAAFSQANAISSFANDTITFISGVDAGQNAFAQAAYDTVNLNALFANTTLTYISGVDAGQNSFAQSAYDQANATNTYAFSAFDSVNLNSLYANTTLSYYAGIQSGQNAYAQAAYAQANAVGSFANTEISIISGINNTQNTNISLLEGAMTSANANIVILFDVNSGQNTYAEAAYAQANAADSLAQSAYNAANSEVLAQSAFAQANIATNIASASYDQANAADSLATSAFAAVNAKSEFANTTLTYISGVDSGQNTFAQAAFNKANAALPLTGGTITGSLQINQDVTVGANLSVLGTFTTYSSNTVTTNSSIIFVATNNTGNVVDMGIVGTFKGGTYNNQQYTGIIRDPNIGKWRFFSNAYSQPTTDVDFSDANIIFDAIEVGGITSPTATINGLELFDYSTAAYAQANAISSYANTTLSYISGVNTGQNAYAQAAFSKANGAVQTAFTTIIANGSSYTSSTNDGTFSITSSVANGINILNPSANTIDFGLRTTGVVVNTYGNTTSIPSITVDAFGRVLSISNNTISTSFSLSGTSGSGSISGGGTLTFAGSSGVTATVSGSTVTIATPQNLQTTASPTFTGVSLSNTANYSTVVTQASLSTILQTQIDSWSTTTYRTAKYLVQMTQGTDYHSIELLLVHNGTTAYLTQYAETTTGSILGTFDASIVSGQLRLLLTPSSSSSMTINIVKNLMSV